jgi:hypothetical protein
LFAQQKGRFHDKRELNASTRCPPFGTPRATSRGLLEGYERLLEMRIQETEFDRRIQMDKEEKTRG